MIGRDKDREDKDHNQAKKIDHDLGREERLLLTTVKRREDTP